jgi:transcriptional regulator with XRE-family HTH domain
MTSKAAKRSGDPVSLGDRIRQARRQARLSQAALAKRLAVTSSAVAQWEARGRVRPTVRHLIEIAEVTRVPFEWLATGRRQARLRDGDIPAVDLTYLAVDVVEERLLDWCRALAPRDRLALMRILTELKP